MMKMTEDINQILDLGYALSSEPYYNRLFYLVLDGCCNFTGADSGQIYVASENLLKNVTTINRTLESRGIRYEVAEKLLDVKAHHMVTYAASHREILRVDDMYTEKRFEVLKLKEFDATYDYRTKSIMVVPIFEPDKKVVGVMVLYNCTDEMGNVIPFSEDYEKLCSSLTVQMATALTNMNQLQEMDELLNSFVACMTTAIDERTPYNANHTNHVAEYCDTIVNEINRRHTNGMFRYSISQNDKEQLHMAAMLHDLGKMITPREVLNKSTRLGDRYEQVRIKLERISLMMKIDKLEGRMDPADWAMADLRLSNFIAELEGLNIRERLSDSEVERVNEMAKRFYVTPNGEKIPYLTEDERKALSIQKGTLTNEERDIVRRHVELTGKLLNEIKFNDKYDRVRTIASNHHEFLDGSGYPNHLTAEQLDIPTRILTILDIYDSLIADDRPYKGTYDVHTALNILDSMANEGKLDKELEKVVHEYMWSANYEKKEILG